MQLEGSITGELESDPKKGEVFLNKGLLFRMAHSYGVSKPTLRFAPQRPQLDQKLTVRVSDARLAIPFSD